MKPPLEVVNGIPVRRELDRLLLRRLRGNEARAMDNAYHVELLQAQVRELYEAVHHEAVRQARLRHGLRRLRRRA